MAPDPLAARADDAALLAWLAAPEIRASSEVVGWATAALGRVCPIVTGLLAIDHRLATEVERELERPAEPRSVEEWGLHFAQRLVSDPDPWVSWAAQVDAGTLAAESSRRRVDPSCPGDPVQAMLLIAGGTNPRA